VSVEVLKINVLKYAISVVAKALIPPECKNKSIESPIKKLNAKN
jgi:hypothetical protein